MLLGEAKMMAELADVQPVKPFVAVLFAEGPDFEAACELLTVRWGRFDFVGTPRRFDVTDYYVDEMGTNLFRRLISFEVLRAPDGLSEWKLSCNAMERNLAVNGRRRANLDIGYLDHNKIVLASVKSAGQKIYLSQGIYADFVARFKEGAYQPFEWTFPDFKDGRYHDELMTIRSRYLQQIRAARRTGNSS